MLPYKINQTIKSTDETTNHSKFHEYLSIHTRMSTFFWYDFQTTKCWYLYYQTQQLHLVLTYLVSLKKWHSRQAINEKSINDKYFHQISMSKNYVRKQFSAYKALKVAWTTLKVAFNRRNVSYISIIVFSMSV